MEGEWVLSLSLFLFLLLSLFLFLFLWLKWPQCYIDTIVYLISALTKAAKQKSKLASNNTIFSLSSFFNTTNATSDCYLSVSKLFCDFVTSLGLLTRLRFMIYSSSFLDELWTRDLSRNEKRGGRNFRSVIASFLSRSRNTFLEMKAPTC